MPRSERTYFEPRLGADLGHVRIHTDARASARAEALGTEAFTRGEHVSFGPGAYEPGTPRGRRTLAHELTHVVQQTAGGRAGVSVGSTPVRAAGKSKDYATGAVAGMPGWTFVAYLNQGRAHLAFRVNDGTPARRIGNIGWVTNNPGSLDLSPKMVWNKDRTKKVPAPEAQRVARKHGAFEKEGRDHPPYGRYAVFPSASTGASAIFPMLEVIAKHNKRPRIGAVLRIYFSGSAKDTTANINYEDENRQRLEKRYEARLKLTEPKLDAAERKRKAGELARGLLNRKFSESFARFHTHDSQYLEASILEVESTRDMARVGVAYTCSGGWDSAGAEAASAGSRAKLAEIRKLVGSSTAKSQLDTLLGCGPKPA